MANQQLVDYIKSQLGAGVSEEMIKNALKTAGWPDADVEDGLKSAKGPVSVAPAAAAVPAKISANQIGATVAPMEKPATAGPVGDLAGGAGANPSAKPTGVQPKINVLDIREAISSKDELLNSMNNMAGGNAMKEAGKATGATTVAGTLLMKGGFFSKISIPEIVMAAVIVALLGGGTWFYLSQSGATSKIDSLASQNAALENQIASMTKTNTDLSAEANTLKDSVKSLTDENVSSKNDLLFFMAVPGSSMATDGITATVRGVLATAKTGQYILTTANGVVIYIKNYKDAKVDALLKPLFGNSVTISGTHTAGSRDFTVTEVNNQPVVVAAPAEAIVAP